ncbi:ferritin/ribonucleotide reductase-like protein [Pseudohyphozyma bogoriensis]|nr:ferritin/ribonucleotide reductase-like protein [Pseudohyphozyma bogoriensis]
MRVSVLTALLGASLAVAAPVAQKKAKRAMTAADIDPVILNYALTLEHLEAAFYKGGLEAYSADDFKAAGYDDWVRYRISEIYSHESSHVSFLSGALSAANVTPTAACEYSFPHTSPATFLAVAQILEGVGTSAYLGAAASVTNPEYLTAAGSILTVEARHSTWIRSAAQHEDGFPAPYDTPLTFNETYSLAAEFITSCPSTNPALPVKAFPALTLGTTGSLSSGEDIVLTFANSTSVETGYAVFLHELSQTVASWDPASGKTTIPDGLAGQIYVVITNANATVSDENTLSSPAVVEIPLGATSFPY